MDDSSENNGQWEFMIQNNLALLKLEQRHGLYFVEIRIEISMRLEITIGGHNTMVDISIRMKRHILGHNTFILTVS